jgi:hypothetical protein
MDLVLLVVVLILLFGGGGYYTGAFGPYAYGTYGYGGFLPILLVVVLVWLLLGRR